MRADQRCAFLRRPSPGIGRGSMPVPRQRRQGPALLASLPSPPHAAQATVISFGWLPSLASMPTISPRGAEQTKFALLWLTPLIAQMALKRHHDFDPELRRSDEESLRYKTHERKAQARCAAGIGTKAHALIDDGNSHRVVLGPRPDLHSPGPLPGVGVSDGVCHGLGHRQRDLLPVGAVRGSEFRDGLSRRRYRCGRGRKLDLVSHLPFAHFAHPSPCAREDGPGGRGRRSLLGLGTPPLPEWSGGRLMSPTLRFKGWHTRGYPTVKSASDA
jgi:hypothetical protein